MCAAAALALGAAPSGAPSPHSAHTTLSIQVESRRTSSPATWLNGFARAVSGNTIRYHSSHPDVDFALISRARRDASTIIWETDTLPAGHGFHNFIWLAGIEKAGWTFSTDVHTWDFRINGERWFTFRNRKDSSALQWTIQGTRGSALAFRTLTVDRHGDLFGTMTLRVPADAFPAGMPLTLTVVGQDAENPDWFMTFQYRFNFVPRIRVEPALLNEGSSVAQMLRLNLDNLEPDRTLTVTAPGRAPIVRPLDVGANIAVIPADPALSTGRLPVTFSVDGIIQMRDTLTIAPVPRRDVYLLPYSHNDIGYTDLQPDVERKQWANIEAALRLIRRTSSYPSESRFRWNFEVVWALDSYLSKAPDSLRGAVLDALRTGDMGMNALYVNPLTGLTNAVQLQEHTRFARTFSAAERIPLTTATVSDIPGFVWGLVPVLARSGVRYFSTAPNSFDRIGNIYDLGDRPFYWASPSGEERVLTWIAGASYAGFHEGELSRLGDEKILRQLRTLESSAYPYSIVMLPYTIGGDNGPPDSTLPDFVRAWNERYASPRLHIATHDMVFSHFERIYGDSLPVRRGDLTPYWEDGAFSTAFETALSRQASNRLVQAEALWALRPSASYPDSTFVRAWRSVVMFDEHTWGAHISVSDPDSSFVRGQWEFKRQFALEADSLSRLLLAAALVPSSAHRAAETAVDVYNTTAWKRSDCVFVPDSLSRAGDRVIDETGRTIPSQRLRSGLLAFVARDVPPVGARRYVITQGSAAAGGSAKASGTTAENGSLRVRVDPSSGSITSLVAGKGEVELVDTSRGIGLNAYLYVAGRDPAAAAGLRNVTVRVIDPGPLVAALVVEGDAPGCRRYRATIRVIDGIERVDIETFTDKIAIREKEGVHIGFPLHVPSGELRYDVPMGIVRPEKDQLPGACRNFYSVQSWVDVSNSSHGVTWTTADAPLIEIGSITAELPWMRSNPSSTHFYSYVMNNYWHTNYKADQDGPVVFRYSLHPHGRFDPAAAVRAGRERLEPMIVARGGASLSAADGLLTIQPEDVIGMSVRRDAHRGGWLLQLYNPTDSTFAPRIRTNGTTPGNLFLQRNFQDPGTPVDAPPMVPPRGIRLLRLESAR